MQHFSIVRLVWLAIFVLLLAACNAADPGESTATAPFSTPATAAPTLAPTSPPTAETGQGTTGTALIESLQVSILESFPVQVQVIISGSLSDGCTTLSGSDIQRDGDVFLIEIETSRNAGAMCTQALVPFETNVSLDVQGLPAGTYTVTAGELSETFTLDVGNVLQPTPDLSGARLTVEASSALPGETVMVNGSGFPAEAMVAIGVGPQGSEYDVIDSVHAGPNGQFTTGVQVPAYAEPGESWVFVGDVANAKVIAEPILIEQSDSQTPVPDASVNQPVNGQFNRTYIYLTALEDNGQSGELIGCGDSAVPVAVDIEPTVAPMTAALNAMLNNNQQFYGDTGLYNVFYQSDLRVAGIDIVNGQANIHLTGTVNLGGVCDSPRVEAQLEKTALQYKTVDSVVILIDGQPLGTVLSGQS